MIATRRCGPRSSAARARAAASVAAASSAQVRRCAGVASARPSGSSVARSEIGVLNIRVALEVEAWRNRPHVFLYTNTFYIATPLSNERGNDGRRPVRHGALDHRLAGEPALPGVHAR